MGQRPSQTLDNKRRKSEPSDQVTPEDNCSGQSPFTPRGVASFSQTKWGRLILWQTGVASLIACSVMLLLSRHWAPVLNEAIEKLPAKGGLNHGILLWPEHQTGELAGNQFLEIIVNPSGQYHDRNADIQIELLRDRWVVGSIFGFIDLKYLSKNFQLDRTTQIPWWGSRRPFLFIGISFSMGLIYIIVSLFLGLLGIWPLKIISFFANRENNFGALWRLATAAWLPAGTLFAMGGLCYALNLLILLKLLILALFCLLTGIFYLFFSAFFIPQAVHCGENPFDPEEAQDSLKGEEGNPVPDNPFD